MACIGNKDNQYFTYTNLYQDSSTLFFIFAIFNPIDRLIQTNSGKEDSRNSNDEAIFRVQGSTP